MTSLSSSVSVGIEWHRPVGLGLAEGSSAFNLHVGSARGVHVGSELSVGLDLDGPDSLRGRGRIDHVPVFIDRVTSERRPPSGTSLPPKLPLGIQQLASGSSLSPPDLEVKVVYAGGRSTGSDRLTCLERRSDLKIGIEVVMHVSNDPSVVESNRGDCISLI